MEKLLRLLCKRLLIQDGHAYTSPSVGCVHRQMTTWKINMNKWVRECSECRCFGTSTDVSTQQLATSHALWNAWHVLCGWAQITLIEDERGKELSDFKRWLLLRIHSQKDCLLVHFWTLIKMTSVNRVGICSPTLNDCGSFVWLIQYIRKRWQTNLWWLRISFQNIIRLLMIPCHMSETVRLRYKAAWTLKG